MKSRELRDEWVAALRSGDYPQGQGALKTADGYCCLGVLCDIVDPKGWSMFTNKSGRFIWRDARGTEDGEHDAKTTESGMLPTTFAFRLEMDSEKEAHLIKLNDGSGEEGEGPASFDDIADWIEANL